MIRQDFEQLPPRAFIEQIAGPALKVYIFLWDRKDRKNRIKMKWNVLTKYYNKNLFKTNIRKIVDAGLLDFEDDKEGFSAELVRWEDVEK